MNLLILHASPKKKGGASPFLLRFIPAVSSGCPKKIRVHQPPAGFSASAGTVSRHGCGVPFCSALCGRPSIPCHGISHAGGRIL